MDILNLLCMAAMTVLKMAAQKGRFSRNLAAKVTNQMSIFMFWHAESKYVNTNMIPVVPCGVLDPRVFEWTICCAILQLSFDGVKTTKTLSAGTQET